MNNVTMVLALLILLLAIGCSDSSETAQTGSVRDFQTPAKKPTSTPNHASQPTSRRCPTPDEGIYFDQVAELSTDLALGLANVGDLTAQVSSNPQLVLDQEWQLNAVLVLAPLGATADTMLSLSAPSSLTSLHYGHQTLARQINAFTELYVLFIDNSDFAILEQAVRKLADIQSISRAQTRKIREHCRIEDPSPSASESSRQSPISVVATRERTAEQDSTPTSAPKPTSTKNPTPTMTPVPFTVQPQISAGYHICGLHAEGHITCWDKGSNVYGASDSPQGLFRQITSNDNANCAVKFDYRVMCWGYLIVHPQIPSVRLAWAPILPVEYYKPTGVLCAGNRVPT